VKVTLRSDDSHSVHEVQLFACVSQRLHDLRSACANTLVLFQYCFSLHFYSLSCQPCFLWCLLLFYEYGTIKYKNSTHDTFFFLIPSSPNSSISDLERKVSVTLWERFRNTVTRLLHRITESTGTPFPVTIPQMFVIEFPSASTSHQRRLGAFDDLCYNSSSSHNITYVML